MFPPPLPARPTTTAFDPEKTLETQPHLPQHLPRVTSATSILTSKEIAALLEQVNPLTTDWADPEFRRPKPIVNLANPPCDASAILHQLSHCLFHENDPKATRGYIRILYCAENVLPSTFFTKKTDNAVTKLLVRYFKIFSELDPQNWPLADIEVVGDILQLACGPPTDSQVRWRFQRVFEKCVKALGEQQAALLLWLFTIQGNTTVVGEALIFPGIFNFSSRLQRCKEFVKILNQINQAHGDKFAACIEGLSHPAVFKRIEYHLHDSSFQKFRFSLQFLCFS